MVSKMNGSTESSVRRKSWMARFNSTRSLSSSGYGTPCFRMAMAWLPKSLRALQAIKTSATASCAFVCMMISLLIMRLINRLESVAVLKKSLGDSRKELNAPPRSLDQFALRKLMTNQVTQPCPYTGCNTRCLGDALSVTNIQNVSTMKISIVSRLSGAPWAS
ncbi:hypothetical protein EMIT0324P_250006 [Pseudomonas chlororaphis]